MESAEKRVWIVEDNENNALVVQTLLQVGGITGSRWVQSGKELFTALEGHPTDQPIDLILLDIQLPDEDGYSILRRLREHPITATTRVIAVTANVMPQDIKQAQNAGFDGFIGKPIDRRQFDTILKQVLAGQSVWHYR